MEIPGPRSDGFPGPSVCAGIVIAMLAMIIIPTAITLQTVHIPRPPRRIRSLTCPRQELFRKCQGGSIRKL